ncbi:ABC transporter permease [Leucobacter denitrificans]|uniref:ABC transporter permease n=1 Tax=Leucobacter denitrificans TaxID=683042 RepID=A0A7G9S6G6_9MICO|nr:ABC transporter permease [Leucobacter denitrificans]QNN63441.1 ABC transporter permease [Leucobacter denitrificans]
MRILRRVMGTPSGCFAVCVFALVAGAALVSFVWLPQDPNAASASRLWLPPHGEHWLGTDGSGRDIASRLIAGSRVSLGVALGTGLLASIIGFALALPGGLGNRPVREVVAVSIDVLVAFPTILLAIMLTAVFGSGIPIVIISLGVAFGVSIGRVLRAELRQVAEADFVLAARVAGLSKSRILIRHLIPSVRPVFVVQLTLSMGTAVLAEASLSYLGFGAPKAVPSWGVMLSETQRYISIYPETVLWPGLAITLLVLAFFLFGDALRDALDVRAPADETAEVMP